MDHHPTTTSNNLSRLRPTQRRLVVVWVGIIAVLMVTAATAGPSIMQAFGQTDDGMDTPPSLGDMAFEESSADLDEAIDGQVTRLYLAYFDRAPEADGLTFWRNKRKAGTSIVTMADTFAESPEFQNKYGDATNIEFVKLVFGNVLDREPAADGLAYWAGVLDNGASRGKVMVGFSDSKEFIADTGTPEPPVLPAPQPAAPTVTVTATTSSTTTPSTTTAVTATKPELPRAYTPTPVTYEQLRGVRALDRISYDWQDKLRGWTIRFHSAKSGFLGLTYPSDRRIDIYVRSDMSDTFLAHVVAHEMGHAVDVTHNSSTDRATWQAARGISWAPWWPTAYATDFSTGAGDFAEAFAFTQIGSYTYYSSRIAGPPSYSQRTLMATLANG